MSGALIAACFWALAATLTAMLPMRAQYPLGLVLLLAVPPLLWWIGSAHGALPVVLGLLAVLSLFRRPLWHIGKKVLKRA